VQLSDFKEFAAGTSLLLTVGGAVFAVLAKSGTQWLSRNRGLKVQIDRPGNSIEVRNLEPADVEEIIKNFPGADSVVKRAGKLGTALQNCGLRADAS
jgi:hypothetical protein